MKLTASFIRGLEKVGGFGGKSDILAQNAVYTGDPGYYKNSLDAIENATQKSITRTAKKWLAQGSYNLEVHPIKKLHAQEVGADRSSVPKTTKFPESKFIDFEINVFFKKENSSTRFVLSPFNCKLKQYIENMENVARDNID